MVKGSPVVLFMKGVRHAPQCGFSSTVVGILDGMLDDYVTVNVLADMNIREGIKAYTNWPTIPQLYVQGEFVGGCDIVREMHGSGELAELLAAGGASEEAPPLSVELTASAVTALRDAAGGTDRPLRFRVTSRFEYQFVFDDPTPTDVQIDADGLTLLVDRASARRAHGSRIDFVDGPQGRGLVVENPNEPATVKQMTVETLQEWLSSDREFTLVDVRTEQEHATARIQGAILFDDRGRAVVEGLSKDHPLVFQCHHGSRSQHAAEHFILQGFKEVHNLSGGIDAWSVRIDSDVPRY
jgi:monothiol glutaredoxin